MAEANPSSSETPVLVGTRKSNLAVWQAKFVCEELQKIHPEETFRVEGITTIGDKDQNTPLSQFSIKGVFTKELDIAQLTEKVDLVVHCVKDLPTTLIEGLELGAILERGSTCDAVIMNPKHEGKTLADLPEGSVIGTSALRRQALINNHFPGLVCKDIRGNVNTRLQKLRDGMYDAIILARTGLERLELTDVISHNLETDKFGTAVGQGALGITCRVGDQKSLELVKKMHHGPTALCIEAERSLLRTLEGGCKVPIAVISHLTPKKHDGEAGERLELELSASVYSVDGKKCVQDVGTVLLQRTPEAPIHEVDPEDLKAAVGLGKDLAERLINKGAKEILAAIKAGEIFHHQAPQKSSEQEE